MYTCGAIVSDRCWMDFLISYKNFCLLTLVKNPGKAQVLFHIIVETLQFIRLRFILTFKIPGRCSNVFMKSFVYQFMSHGINSHLKLGVLALVSYLRGVWNIWYMKMSLLYLLAGQWCHLVLLLAIGVSMMVEVIFVIYST